MRFVLTLTLGFVAMALTACLILEAGMSTGESFRDCESCPEIVIVPPGSFMMAATDAEIEFEAEQSKREGYSAPPMQREQPLHRVTIDYKLAVSKHEVTRGEFARFIQATGHATGNECFSFGEGEKTLIKDGGWKMPGFSQSDTHPVVCVSWNDAKAYALWLGELTGAEWEYVTRGGRRRDSGGVLMLV